MTLRILRYYYSLFSGCVMLLTECEGKANFIQHVFRGTCDGYPANATRLENVHVKRWDGNVMMSFKLVVDKDYHNDVKVALESQKCKGADALDTCENTRVFKIFNNCKLLKKQPWKAFAMAASPPLNCPFKKMIHTIQNATVEVPNFLLLPLGDGYYKTKVIFRDQLTDEFIMCIYGESLLFGHSMN